MTDAWNVVAEVIRARRTEKHFLAPGTEFRTDAESRQVYDRLIRESLAAAGWAPFHFDRKRDGLAEPWRVYLLEESSCRKLGKRLGEWVPDLKPGNKFGAMMAVCSGLALFNWVPMTAEDSGGMTFEKLEAVNREHLAATAAAIQNFLLLCTAAKIGTYWGSGELIERNLFPHLGIGSGAPRSERLAGAVVYYYPVERPPGTESAFGANRSRRSPDADWLKIIELQ